MHLLSKILEALPLALLSAGVILLFNGIMQALVVASDPGADISFELGVLASAQILIKPALMWPWLMAGGAVAFLAGMVTRR